jgi:hypothetical protein
MEAVRMEDYSGKIELSVECHNCQEVNYVYLDESDFDETTEFELGVEDTVCTDDAVDYIFNELVKDGFATSSAGIRAVLSYFHKFCVEKLAKEAENNENVQDGGLQSP